ncbi:hypothetical protein [Eggerthia catenaformis]|uniref:hypothetical protein n=1 Tax=Eggerthia catenaformis TaxID=31973 RepID=UPI0028F15B9D|nr:hypothetical protein [Eggerthia catenaformis]
MINEKKDLEDIIGSSLNKLYEKDIYLIKAGENIEKPVNADVLHNSERSIVHMFAYYFEELYKEKYKDHNLNIDVEYNRNLYDIKRLGEDCIIPDFIFHERGKNKNNILVIEFKTWWNSEQAKDKEKIKKLCEEKEYQYQYGASIIFGKSREEVDIKWYPFDE